LPWLEEHQVFFNLGLLQPFFSSLSSLGLTNMKYSFNTNMRYSFNTFCLFSTSHLIFSCIALRIMRRSCNFLQLLATSCNFLQLLATSCNFLQLLATSSLPVLQPRAEHS
jgi:hypothetical protein